MAGPVFRFFRTVKAGSYHIERKETGKAKAQNIESSNGCRHGLSCPAAPELCGLIPEKGYQKDRSGYCRSCDITGIEDRDRTEKEQQDRQYLNDDQYYPCFLMFCGISQDSPSLSSGKVYHYGLF